MLITGKDDNGPFSRMVDGAAERSPFRPVERHRAFEEVVLQIEKAISESRLKVGDRLPSERDLAEIFDVSRSSVREALRILEAFGVLAARRGRGPDAGSTVTAVERNGLPGILRLYAKVLRIPLRDLVDVRVALETMTARAAAERGADPRLSELAEEMSAEHDTDAFLGLDTEFHVTLATASGNALAPLLMEALREAISREMRRGFEMLDDLEAVRLRVATEHAEIAALVAAGDSDGAARSVERHVRGFYSLVLERQERGGADAEYE